MSVLQNGKYRITNVSTSLRLDDKGDHNESPPVTIYAGNANEGPHQIWEITSVGDGVYKLRNEATRMVLDGNGNGAIYTHPLQEGNKHQQWRIVQHGDFYCLTSQETELRLESSGGHNVKGAKPIDAEKQKWVIVKV